MVITLAVISGFVIITWMFYFVSDKVYKKLKENNLSYAVVEEVVIFYCVLPPLLFWLQGWH